jgi:tetratricopeptide (TPR) repeat protein
MSKSIKLAPGERMTVSKSGIGYSAGGKGYRVTKRASSAVTQTVSLPGSGLSHTKTISSSGATRSSPARSPQAAAPSKPGLFAPRAEKDLFDIVTKQNWGRFATLAAAHPDWRPPVASMDGIFALASNDRPRAQGALEFAFASGIDPSTHPFVQRYVATASIKLGIASGVTAELPLDRQAIGLALAELRQDAGDLGGAIEIVEQLEPTTPAAVSLAELYLEAGRADEAIAMTNGVANEDDATALLCVFRGAALRQTGAHGASLEALKEALRSRKRAAEIRHRALIERSATYLALGKSAMARKDLERIQAEDSSYPGLTEALASLDS